MTRHGGAPGFTHNPIRSKYLTTISHKKRHVFTKWKQWKQPSHPSLCVCVFVCVCVCVRIPGSGRCVLGLFAGSGGAKGGVFAWKLDLSKKNQGDLASNQDILSHRNSQSRLSSAGNDVGGVPPPTPLPHAPTHSPP